MRSHFTPAFFAANRARLRESFISTGPIVITANGLLQRGADSAFPFAQDANFWYLTGIDEPDIVLVMDGESEYLIVPPRDASRTAFDGAIDDDALTMRSAIATVLEGEHGWNRLASRLQKAKQVATLAAAPAYIEHYGLYANPARARLNETLRTYNTQLEILDIGMHIVQLRMIKQAPELKAMQQAIDITAAAIRESTRQMKLAKYEFEYELEAELTKGFRSRGASGHAFEPIVAGGERACTLHNVSSSGQLKSGELVVIDVGAEVEHYAADITRTVIKGRATARQKAVYAAVLEVQQYAYSLLKPGVLMADYEKSIELFMGEQLRTLGLIRAVDRDSVRKYYPHATSHFLGLNVHDAGDYAQPLAAGVVITVEPGIYIPEEGIGIRIEDDVLITDTGIDILTRGLPAKL